MRDMFIHVVINDSPKAESRVQSHERTSNGHYTVVISADELKMLNAKPAVVVAHELGHVLGLEFELPGHKQVGQTPEDRGSVALAHLNGSFLNREHEAWDLAEEMFKIRSMSTETYLQGQKEILYAVEPIINFMKAIKQ